LQVCGWLAAYVGSALTSGRDLYFRNLDGTGVLHRDVQRDGGLLTTRTRLTNLSRAAEMIIEKFALQIWQDGAIVYEADTSFGFFTEEALATQAGLRDVPGFAGELLNASTGRSSPMLREIADAVPVAPDDVRRSPMNGLQFPAKALRMIDRIEHFDPVGGPAGLGVVHASAAVEPNAWFFDAHFYRDPVCPGSLGIEALLQVFKFMAMQRWQDRLGASHRFLPMVIGREHQWRYRGQIRPTNGRVDVAAVVTDVDERSGPTMIGDGVIYVDSMPIYALRGFGVQLAASDAASD